MLRNSLFFTGVFLICALAGAQDFEGRRLQGKVENEGKGVPDVHVLNTSEGKATISDEAGDFSIQVKLNDTLLFSAVQFKRKVLVATSGILESATVIIPLEEFVNELDEVVVRPYNLSGDLARDMETMQTGQVVSATSLGLPNAYVKPLMQSERLLREASMGPFNVGMLLNVPFNPMINAITGRTKMLKKRVSRDRKYLRAGEVRGYFADSLFLKQLLIPKDRIDDFMYFCEVDASFDSLARSEDTIGLWELLLRKSTVYRKNNKLE